jgi:hypothetical protein
MFRKLHPLPASSLSGEIDPIQLGPFERAGLDHCAKKEELELRCNSKMSILNSATAIEGTAQRLQRMNGKERRRKVFTAL